MRRLRSARGLSQEALAHESDMNRTYLSAVERSERNVSIDNIARFFGGGAVKPGSFSRSARPKMDIPEASGAAGLKKGQRVRHSKYGEGTVVMREGEGDEAKLTVLFPQHGMKKLMEKFANLQKV